jgi:hypothetical protein
MNLSEKTAPVETREDLATFIRRLRQDLMENPEAWENAKLPDFLEALAAWTEDMDGYFRNTGEETPEQPDWQLVGIMLLAARDYE